MARRVWRPSPPAWRLAPMGLETRTGSCGSTSGLGEAHCAKLRGALGMAWIAGNLCSGALFPGSVSGTCSWALFLGPVPGGGRVWASASGGGPADGPGRATATPGRCAGVEHRALARSCPGHRGRPMRFRGVASIDRTLTGPCALVYRQLIWRHISFASVPQERAQPSPVRHASCEDDRAVQNGCNGNSCLDNRHGIASPPHHRPRRR
jgi:hypothetical protein